MAKYAPREGGQRRAVNTKITEGIRTRLETAAATANRTLSAEIEWRLVRSFLDDKVQEFDEIIVRDPATRDLLRLLEAVLGSIYRYTEKSWESDLPSRDAVACAVGLVLQLAFDNAPIPLPPVGSADRKALDRLRVVTRAQGRMMALGIMAPRLEDKKFQEFVDAAQSLSGFVPEGPDDDYEKLRQEFESLSNPPEQKG